MFLFFTKILGAISKSQVDGHVTEATEKLAFFINKFIIEKNKALFVQFRTENALFFVYLLPFFIQKLQDSF
ncbi:hypothetical protein IIQ_00070 [Bacillus cereus VD118]|uniref:Uncharacterized protein n=1 Tax=Bacillus cereus VD118 TaxID=1053231 RepID=R8QP39_BACCE|nr:hypothetical protein IIQ_00070 [Bacillus cereus VD118]